MVVRTGADLGRCPAVSAGTALGPVSGSEDEFPIGARAGRPDLNAGADLGRRPAVSAAADSCPISSSEDEFPLGVGRPG